MVEQTCIAYHGGKDDESGPYAEDGHKEHDGYRDVCYHRYQVEQGLTAANQNRA